MKKINKFYPLMMILLLGNFVIFQNCSKVGFSSLPEDVNVSSSNIETVPDEGDNSKNGDSDSGEYTSGPVCTLTETLKQKPTKVIFVVDQSASNNLTGVMNHDVSESTDLGRIFRTEAMRTVLMANPASTFLQYSIFGFWGDSTKSRTPSWTEGFLSEQTQLVSAVDNFASVAKSCSEYGSRNANYFYADCGGTPYGDALDEVARQIDTNDIYRYLIIFISDGLPSGYFNAGSNTDFSDERQKVLTKVDLLLAQKPGQVILNTVYYYQKNADKDAIDFVKEMAVHGKGASVSIKTSDSLDLSTTIRVQTEECK